MPHGDQRGLRMRLAQEARRIAAQHEFLDALEATTRAALAVGDAAACDEALLHFESALVAHFEIEERVQFPALHGLAVELDPELAELVRAHGRFRAALAAMRDAVEDVDPDARAAVLAEFEALAAELRTHETHEETLLSDASRLP